MFCSFDAISLGSGAIFAWRNIDSRKIMISPVSTPALITSSSLELWRGKHLGNTNVDASKF